MTQETSPDLLDMLDEMVKVLADSDTPLAVKVDPETNRVAGHIVVWTDVPVRRRKEGSDGREYVAFLDMGPVLSLWSGQGGEFRPTEARELGEALIVWADRAEAAS